MWEQIFNVLLKKYLCNCLRLPKFRGYFILYHPKCYFIYYPFAILNKLVETLSKLNPIHRFNRNGCTFWGSEAYIGL